jgi:hypothetical protein
MAKRRKAAPKRGRLGDAKGYIPTQRVDSQTVLLELAEKAKLAKHSGRKSSRNKSGLTVNHAAFGNQYGRLSMSLVPKLTPMVKVGDKLMFAPEEPHLSKLYHEANALLATVEKDAPIPDGIAPRGKARATKHTTPRRKHRGRWSRTTLL